MSELLSPCVLLGSWQSGDSGVSKLLNIVCFKLWIFADVWSHVTKLVEDYVTVPSHRDTLKISIPVSLLSLRASNVSPILSCQAQWGLAYDMLTRWQEIPSSLIPTLVQFKVYSSCQSTR
jgi:hypothetical protein